MTKSNLFKVLGVLWFIVVVFTVFIIPQDFSNIFGTSLFMFNNMVYSVELLK